MEFALVLPVFLLIVFGLIDGARYVFAWNTLRASANTAVRGIVVQQWPTDCVGAVSRSACATAIVNNRTHGVIEPWTVTTTCERYDRDAGARSSVTMAECSIGDDLRVDVSIGSFRFLTPLFGQLVGNVSVKGTASMQVEGVSLP